MVIVLPEYRHLWFYAYLDCYGSKFDSIMPIHDEKWYYGCIVKFMEKLKC